MTERLLCETCNKSYASIFSLSNHKRISHADKKDNNRTKNVEDGLYHCRYCDTQSFINSKY